MITDNLENPIVDRNAQRPSGSVTRRRSMLERQPEGHSKPALSNLREALSVTGKPPTMKRTADCGELFRSWAFPRN